MKFICAIQMDNAAFVDDDQELANILSSIALRMRIGGHKERSATVVDTNGSRVGSWSITR